MWIFALASAILCYANLSFVRWGGDEEKYCKTVFQLGEEKMKNNIREKKDNTTMYFFGDEYLSADEEIRKEIINHVLNLKWEASYDKEN